MRHAKSACQTRHHLPAEISNVVATACERERDYNASATDYCEARMHMLFRHKKAEYTTLPLHVCLQQVAQDFDTKPSSCMTAGLQHQLEDMCRAHLCRAKKRSNSKGCVHDDA